MLRADGKPDGVGLDALVQQLFRAELRVGGGGRVNDQALHIGHIGQQGEDIQIVDKPLSLLLSALDLKGKNGAPPLGKYF